MSQGCGCQSLKCSFNVLSGTKPNWKGGAKPCPKQHHPVLQGPPFSIKCWLATGCMCPPEAHNQKHMASLKTKCKRPPTQEHPHFLCRWGNTTSSWPHLLQTIINFRLAVQSSQHTVSSQCLINRHGLLPHSHRHLVGFKGHTESGTRPWR